MDNTDLDRTIKLLANMVKQVPNMFDMAKRNPSFPEIERIVVASIANADSLPEALGAYDDYVGLIPDWKFVFASDGGAMPGLSTHRTFSDGSVVRGLFSKKSVIVLDPETREDMNGGRKAVFPIDYSISLDTQALSYLAPFIDGKSSKLPDDFQEIFSFIADDRVFVDAVPYMLENLPNISRTENIEPIKKRLEGYETLRTIDLPHFRATGEIRSASTKAEQSQNVDELLSQMIHDASDPDVRSYLDAQLARQYAVLLKMATIQLRNPKMALVDKLYEFTEFLDRTLCTIHARETVVAAEYFAKGQKLNFFSRLHKSPSNHLPKLFKALKNMAWDFFHVRYVEGAATLEGAISKNAKQTPRYFFPSLLTCDKDLVEVIDLYPLKSYAYQKGSRQLIPFPAIDWIARVATDVNGEASLMDRLFSRAAIAKRESCRENALDEIHGIVQRLESEFSHAAVLG